MQLVGPPEGFPALGKANNAWLPAKSGEHFVVLGLDYPVFVTEIKAYEVLAPGRIVAIYGSLEYSGNSTEWVSLYRGKRIEDPQQQLLLFQPQLCPVTHTRVKYIKIVVDLPAPSDLLYSLDVVEIYGSMDQPAPLVHARDTLHYHPIPGVHGHLESLALNGVDCYGRHVWLEWLPVSHGMLSPCSWQSHGLCGGDRKPG